MKYGYADRRITPNRSEYGYDATQVIVEINMFYSSKQKRPWKYEISGLPHGEYRT